MGPVDRTASLTVAKRLATVSVYYKALAINLRISLYVSSLPDFAAGTIVIRLPNEKLVDRHLPGLLGS